MISVAYTVKAQPHINSPQVIVGGLFFTTHPGSNGYNTLCLCLQPQRHQTKPTFKGSTFPVSGGLWWSERSNISLCAGWRWRLKRPERPMGKKKMLVVTDLISDKWREQSRKFMLHSLLTEYIVCLAMKTFSIFACAAHSLGTTGLCLEVLAVPVSARIIMQRRTLNPWCSPHFHFGGQTKTLQSPEKDKPSIDSMNMV